MVACSAGTSASAFTALNAGQVDALSINDDNSFYRQYDGIGSYQWLATQDNTLGHRVLAVAGITSYLQLAGKNIAVDALVSGTPGTSRRRSSLWPPPRTATHLSLLPPSTGVRCV